jgi:ER-bound oxygenase mpaB/B'/Rubber oxygenase, catalytic domain
MLDELRRAGDPSADAVVGELARTQQSRAVSRILRHLVDNDEAEDYYYRWRAIGEMLGIDPVAIPTDVGAARELTDLIVRRNHRRSEEGIEMTRALFELHSSSLPVRSELERSWTASGVFPAIDNELIQFAQAQPA